MSKVLRLELPEALPVIQMVLALHQEHFGRSNQDMLDRVLELMETPEGTLFLRGHFWLLPHFLGLFKQRGQANSAKRVYYVMRELFDQNYKQMDISQSLSFLAADYEFMEEFTDITRLVFDNIVQHAVNAEVENLGEIFEALGQITLPEDQTPRLR